MSAYRKDPFQPQFGLDVERIKKLAQAGYIRGTIYDPPPPPKTPGPPLVFFPPPSRPPVYVSPPPKKAPPPVFYPAPIPAITARPSPGASRSAPGGDDGVFAWACIVGFPFVFFGYVWIVTAILHGLFGIEHDRAFDWAAVSFLGLILASLAAIAGYALWQGVIAARRWIRAHRKEIAAALKIALHAAMFLSLLKLLLAATAGVTAWLGRSPPPVTAAGFLCAIATAALLHLALWFGVRKLLAKRGRLLAAGKALMRRDWEFAARAAHGGRDGPRERIEPTMIRLPARSTVPTRTVAEARKHAAGPRRPDAPKLPTPYPEPWPPKRLTRTATDEAASYTRRP